MHWHGYYNNDGFYREAIGSREARRLMADGLSQLYPSTDFEGMETDELAEVYRDYMG